jgi:putative membrane protein
MDEVKGSPATEDPRIYFAAERTFLAWIRTGLGLMGVGFAVSRFGLFLREMQANEVHSSGHGTVIRSTGLSVYSGVALVALGVLVNVTSVWQHLRTVKELREGIWIAGRVSMSAVILGLLLAVVGVGMGVYLLYLR